MHEQTDYKWSEDEQIMRRFKRLQAETSFLNVEQVQKNMLTQLKRWLVMICDQSQCLRCLSVQKKAAEYQQCRHYLR